MRLARFFRSINFGGGLIIWLAAVAVQAHQQQVATTQLFYNATSGNLEVIHRIIAHDAEHMLKRIIDSSADLTADKAMQQRVSDYIASRCRLAVNTKPVALNYVGYELDGRFLWVYQELPDVALVSSISIEFDALTEIYPKQTNLVNLEGLGPIQSVELTASKPSHKFLLGPSIQ
jgi:hypothetical protein